MTTDRTAAPALPVHAERPAARAASLPRDAARRPATPDAPAFVLTVTPPAAPPASVPVPVAVPATAGAVAASARTAAPPA